MSMDATMDQRSTRMTEKHDRLFVRQAPAIDGSAAFRIRLPGLIQLPAPELSGEATTPTSATRLVLQRQFNRPTGLLPEQRCYVGGWLDGMVESAWVNDCLLAEAPGELGDANAAFRWLPREGAAYNQLTLVVLPQSTVGVHIHQVALGLEE